MKRKLFITLTIVGTLCFAGQFFTTAAHPDAHDKNAFTPDTLQWGPPPPPIPRRPTRLIAFHRPGRTGRRDRGQSGHIHR